MSIKARVKRIEGKFPDEKMAAGLVPKEDLLFLDYEDYRKLTMEFTFSLFMNNFEKAAALEKELLEAIETMQPITKPSKYNEEAHKKLVQHEIARYMDEHPETETFNQETIRHEIGERWGFYGEY